MRKVSVIAAVVGALLIISAGVVRWGVAPAVVKLPADTDITRTYAGTASTLLNAQALAAGGSSNLVLRDVPIEATHKVKVLKSTSGSSLIADTQTLSAAGTPVSSTTNNYAVDRKTLGRGSGFAGVVSQTGLTFNWPIDTARKNYTGWVPSTGKTTTLTYTGTTTRGGVKVYTFTTSTSPQLITDAQQLAGLPRTLPKAQLPALATAAGIPAEVLRGAAAALAQLPDNVPLAYTYKVDATYYVAPASGVVVDLTQREVRSVGLAGTAFPPFTMADVSFTSTPATLAAAAKDARDKGNSIALVQSTLPWSLGAAGFVLLVAGALLGIAARPASRRPLPQVPTAPVPGGHAVPEPRQTPTDQPTETLRGS